MSSLFTRMLLSNLLVAFGGELNYTYTDGKVSDGSQMVGNSKNTYNVVAFYDDGAKANHLAYLGDATVGERVNYGAGSITANYDGANKHRTTIGADVHVGSNCVLVAPVTIGAGATIGGGSTITKEVAPGSLAIGRARQVAFADWSRPQKKPK